ncbi:hypothetical protein LOAG_15073, partial [Loa loa]
YRVHSAREYTLFGPSIETYLIWKALPIAIAIASIARNLRARKLLPHDKGVRGKGYWSILLKTQQCACLIACGIEWC